MSKVKTILEIDKGSNDYLFAHIGDHYLSIEVSENRADSQNPHYTNSVIKKEQALKMAHAIIDHFKKSEDKKKIKGYYTGADGKKHPIIYL